MIGRLIRAADEAEAAFRHLAIERRWGLLPKRVPTWVLRLAGHPTQPPKGDPDKFR